MMLRCLGALDLMRGGLVCRHWHQTILTHDLLVVCIRGGGLSGVAGTPLATRLVSGMTRIRTSTSTSMYVL
jgi:hypothetical protein